MVYGIKIQILIIVKIVEYGLESWKIIAQANEITKSSTATALV
jgi:hypothetical protein